MSHYQCKNKQALRYRSAEEPWLEPEGCRPLVFFYPGERVWAQGYGVDESEMMITAHGRLYVVLREDFAAIFRQWGPSRDRDYLRPEGGKSSDTAKKKHPPLVGD